MDGSSVYVCIDAIGIISQPQYTQIIEIGMRIAILQLGEHVQGVSYGNDHMSCLASQSRLRKSRELSTTWMDGFG